MTLADGDTNPKWEQYRKKSMLFKSEDTKDFTHLGTVIKSRCFSIPTMPTIHSPFVKPNDS